jgi:hypothetical protein
MATIPLTAANLKTVPTVAAGGPSIQAIVIDPAAPASLTLAAPVATIDQAIASFAQANTAGHTALPPPNNFHFFDGSVQVGNSEPGDGFTGPTPGITAQFIDLTPDNLGINGLRPNLLMASDSGNDVLSVVGGRNILVGGSGTDTYVGSPAGTGNVDTFLANLADGKTDATIFNFHTGDDAALIGADATNFALSFADSVNGLVLTASPTVAGHNGATLTLQGFTTADIGTKLSFGVDTSAATPYLFVHGN